MIVVIYYFTINLWFKTQ